MHYRAVRHRSVYQCSWSHPGLCDLSASKNLSDQANRVAETIKCYFVAEYVSSYSVVREVDRMMEQTDRQTDGGVFLPPGGMTLVDWRSLEDE